jgi:hypothetical protein
MAPHTIHHHIHRFQEVIFKYVFYLNYMLYFVIAFGLSAKAPHYLSTLDYLIKLYVSIFLIYRFNPFRKVVFTDLDRKIAFSAGVFVFATTAINKILISSLEEIKDFILLF